MMQELSVSGISVVQWNPARPALRGRLGRRLPVRRRVNNFGDLLGPVIVREIAGRLDSTQPSKGRGRLFSVGSVMHFTRPGDIVWGTGINGKHPTAPTHSRELQVRAVRGPRTREILLNAGATVPEVYGDPALLLSALWPTPPRGRISSGVLYVPNFHDLSTLASVKNLLDPRSPLQECVSRIAGAERVISSSLHGIIVAEAYGVPTTLVAPSQEPLFKYADYYEGTGRSAIVPVSDFKEAEKAEPTPAPEWDPRALLNEFPYDLWMHDTGENPSNLAERILSFRS